MLDNMLYNALNDLRPTRIVHHSGLNTNQQSWSAIDNDWQELFLLSA